MKRNSNKTHKIFQRKVLIASAILLLLLPLGTLGGLTLKCNIKEEKMSQQTAAVQDRLSRAIDKNANIEYSAYNDGDCDRGNGTSVLIEIKESGSSFKDGESKLLSILKEANLPLPTENREFYKNRSLGDDSTLDSVEYAMGVYQINEENEPHYEEYRFRHYLKDKISCVRHDTNGYVCTNGLPLVDFDNESYLSDKPVTSSFIGIDLPYKVFNIKN